MTDQAERTKLVSGLRQLYDAAIFGYVHAGWGYSPHPTWETLISFNELLNTAKALDSSVPDIAYSVPAQRTKARPEHMFHGDLLTSIKTVLMHVDPDGIDQLRDCEKERELFEDKKRGKFVQDDRKAKDGLALPTKYDVFLSYTASDSHIAEELREEIEAAGLTCFMAEKDVRVGADWDESIRDAILTARRIVLLITPRSIDKHWPLMETGAAWVSNKEIVPALINVSPSELGEPISRHQARTIETMKQRRKLVNELSRT